MREETVSTEIYIDAPAQTVWSILDDLESYPAWNRVLPTISGRTTVGSFIEAEIVFSGMAPQPFRAEIIRIVPARELRWISRVETEPQSTAEHFFILTPTSDGGTALVHGETFIGPMVDMIWPMIDTTARADYEAMNLDLKSRAEAAARAEASVALHPALAAASNISVPAAPVELLCRCEQEPVRVRIQGPWQHTHLCGCSQCWRPSDAALALIAAVPAGLATVIAGSQFLAVVDKTQPIKRHACKRCGTHMVGRVDNTDHHFFGLDFAHPELAGTPPPKPEFAGFVSSLVEAGTSPVGMVAIRRALARAGIPASDIFSSEIMDLIAWHKLKIAGQT